MEILDRITAEMLRRMTSAQVFERGRVLYQMDAVTERALVDNMALEAAVLDGGRTYLPDAYEEESDILTACDCRGSQRGMCPHVVALLLAWANEPHSFMSESSMDEVALDAAFNADETEFGTDEGRAAVDAIAASLTPAAQMPSGLVNASLEDAQREYAQLLSALNLTQLRDLAKRLGQSIGGNLKDNFVQTLAGVLVRRETLSAIWPQLSRHTQKLLGVLPILSTKNRVYAQHARQAFQMFDSKAASFFDPLLIELSGFGLIFNAYGIITLPSLLPFYLPPDPDFGPQHPDHARFKPHAAPPAPVEFALLVTRLALVLKASPDHFVARPAPAPHPLEKQNAALLGWPHYPAELDALQYEKNRGSIAYTKSFGVPPALSPLMDEARDDVCRAVGAKADRVDFALRLLIYTGVVKLIPGRPLEVIDARFNEFLAQPPLLRAVTLFAAFASLNSWTEIDRLSELHHAAPHLRHVGNISFGQGYAFMLNAFATARSLLLLMLRRVPAERWIDLDAFVARARAFQHNPAVWPLGHSFYLDLNGRAPNVANPNDWRDTYGPYVEAILTGPLWWQGAVELAYRLDRVVAFRLTPMATRLFGQDLTYEPPRSAEARDQPTVTFTSSGDLALHIEAAPADLLSWLARVCEARSTSDGQLAYHLSPAGVSRVFESGWDADRLIEALQQSIGQALPPAWIEAIKSWWQNFGTLHLYADVAVIELADDYALTELLSATSLSKYLLYRFSPRLIAVRADGVEALRTEVIRKGYTPKTLITDH